LTNGSYWMRRVAVLDPCRNKEIDTSAARDLSGLGGVSRDHLVRLQVTSAWPSSAIAGRLQLVAQLVE
jgi:hypothetical protein